MKPKIKQSNTPVCRAALVTGGTRGIGKACVYALARNGFRVAFCYKESSRAAQQIECELQSEGHAVIGYACDVTDYAAVTDLYASTAKTIGVIDTLVNNAGAAHRMLFTDESPDTFENVLAINLKSAMYVSRVYAPDMLSASFGRIINISSVHGTHGASMETVYSAAKAGLDGFTKALAKELSPSGITVNALAPAWVDTLMTRGFTASEKTAFLKAVSAQESTPQQAAAAVLKLASETAGHINGKILCIEKANRL
ncbi:MAG: SDR family oxidoreductase [Firmicutes bacterium]|nr:SDR family oxidoreductase [Bacillota bacterium]